MDTIHYGAPADGEPEQFMIGNADMGSTEALLEVMASNGLFRIAGPDASGGDQDLIVCATPVKGRSAAATVRDMLARLGRELLVLALVTLASLITVPAGAETPSQCTWECGAADGCIQRCYDRYAPNGGVAVNPTVYGLRACVDDCLNFFCVCVEHTAVAKPPAETVFSGLVLAVTVLGAASEPADGVIATPPPVGGDPAEACECIAGCNWLWQLCVSGCISSSPGDEFPACYDNCTSNKGSCNAGCFERWGGNTLCLGV